MARRGDAHDLTLLLPFYVNGTLSPQDQARMDEALADDAGLRDELELVRRLRRLVRPPVPPRRP